MANILNSRKPVLWVMVAVMVMMIAATIALLANPPSNVKDVPGTKTSLIDNVTTGGGEIDAAQAIAIDKSLFDEYLLTKPDMKVEDPEFSAEKKQDHNSIDYWSVTIKPQEPEYLYHHFEVWISMDGDHVTLATG